MTEKEIKDQYKTIHDDLTEAFYNQELSKEDFDTQHGQNWADMETELIAEGYMELPEPKINFKEEIKLLKDRLSDLEKK